MHTTYALSDEQQAICGWFEKPQPEKRNLVVRARAGTGKTYTIIEAILRAMESRILLAAFNKRIQTELAAKITNPAAEAFTLHAVGFKAVQRYWNRLRIESNGSRADGLALRACGRTTPDPIIRLVSKLMTQAREQAPLAMSGAELVGLAYDRDCVPDEEWRVDGFTVETVADFAYKAMELAAERPTDGAIDFADMLYLPIRNKFLRGIYDLVVIDEAQDMTRTQLLLAQGVCTPGGRIVVVGDDRQGIYAFRGADSQALDNLKTDLDAEELGLTTTYRCGKAIVAMAQRIVPDYQAAPTAHEGEVIQTTLATLYADVQPTDFILSRKNAPLVKIALTLIRQDKRTRIEGRDIGAGLAAIAKKLATGAAKNSIPQWLEKLQNWRTREVERAEKANRPAKADLVADQYETLTYLADGVTGIAELLSRLDRLFGELTEQERASMIVCSSVHKAKGLEANRVWVLKDTLHPMVACDCGHRHANGCKCGCKTYSPNALAVREEQNIEYVAITRAKQTLFWTAGGDR